MKLKMRAPQLAHVMEQSSERAVQTAILGTFQLYVSICTKIRHQYKHGLNYLFVTLDFFFYRNTVIFMLQPQYFNLKL